MRKSLGLVLDLHVDFSYQLEPRRLVPIVSRRYTLGRLSGCMTFDLPAIDDSCGVVTWRRGRVSLRLRLLLFRHLALLVLALPRGRTSFASSGPPLLPASAARIVLTSWARTEQDYAGQCLCLSWTWCGLDSTLYPASPRRGRPKSNVNVD